MKQFFFPKIWLGLLALPLLGCKGEFPQGQWVSRCQFIQGQYQVASLWVDVDQVRYQITGFGANNPPCDSPQQIWQSQGNLQLSTPPNPAGALPFWEVDLWLEQSQLTLLDPALTQQWNQDWICGESNWQPGTPKTLMQENCPFPLAGRTLHQIAALDGELLYLGETNLVFDGSREFLRPYRLNSFVPLYRLTQD